MLERYNVEKLVLKSDIIVIGEVVGSGSMWNTPDGKEPMDKSGTYVIYTDSRIKVEEYLKGKLDDQTITVRMLGGTVGKNTQNVEDQPFYGVGEKVLAFLGNDPDVRIKDIGDKHFATVGLTQGKISISLNNELVLNEQRMPLEDAEKMILSYE